MKQYTLTIPEELENTRLDSAIASLCPEISRSRIQKLILQGMVEINGDPASTQRISVHTDDKILLQAPLESPIKDKPQSLPLNIAYEDSSLMVVNKPMGLIVHPGAGKPDHTLLNAILAKCPDNATLPQAGLIHRLDKDTTGLLIIAKNEASYFKLNQSMAKRAIKRSYLALVKGIVHQGGTINEPLARHTKNRQKYTVHPTGRSAITHYEVEERFTHHTLLRVTLETGRTHQIRVHLHYIHHPVVGDFTYHRGHHIKQSTLNTEALNALYSFRRQALHAAFLSFEHPEEDKIIELSCPLPEDFDKLLSLIRPLA